jgi:succinate dehydrogenase/fumarate reductase-like Fe-S protein
MKPVNFFGQDMKLSGVNLLSHCIVCGFCYDQTKNILEDEGYYLPLDQYEAYSKVLDIQINLDIGERRIELERPEDIGPPIPEEDIPVAWLERS